MALNISVLISLTDRISAPLKGIGGHIEANAAKYRQAGAIMTAAGGAIVGTLLTATNRAAAMGDEISKASDKTGIAAQDLGGLRHAADLANVGFGELEMALARMSRVAVDTPQHFEALGIATRDATGRVKDGKELFLEAAEALAQIESPTERAAAAMNIFGRSGANLLPLLKDGRTAIEEQMEAAGKLGLNYEELAQQAADYQDAKTRLSGALSGVAMTIGGHLMPILTELAERVAAAIGRWNEWAAAHPTLSRGLILVVGGAGLLLTVLGPIVMLLPSLVAGIKILAGWKAAWATVTTAKLIPALLAKAGTLTGAVIPSLAATAAAIGPVLLVLAALAAAIWLVVRAWNAYKAAAEAGKQASENIRGQADLLGDDMAQAPIHLRHRVQGMLTGGGYTGQDAAYAEWSAGQAIRPEQVAHARQKLDVNVRATPGLDVQTKYQPAY